MRSSVEERGGGGAAYPLVSTGGGELDMGAVPVAAPKGKGRGCCSGEGRGGGGGGPTAAYPLVSTGGGELDMGAVPVAAPKGKGRGCCSDEGRGGGGGATAAIPLVATRGGELEKAVTVAAPKEKGQGCCGDAPTGEVSVPTAAYGATLMQEIAGSPFRTAQASYSGTPVLMTPRKSLNPLSACGGDGLGKIAFDGAGDGLGKNGHSVKSYRISLQRALACVLLIFLVTLSTSDLACADLSPRCEVSSMSTNIRLFCDSYHPSSSCCDSIIAAVANEDGKQCLCMVGSSPEIMTVGFSPENLISFHNICTQQEEDFECDSQSDKSELADENSPVIEDDDDDSMNQRNQRRGTHRSNRMDPNSESEDVSTTEEHEHAIFPRNEHKETISEQHQQARQRDQSPSTDSHTTTSVIGVMAGLIVSLVIILAFAAAVKYKRQQTDFRQLLSVAVAAAVPPVPRQRAAVVPPVPHQGAAAVPPVPHQGAAALPAVQTAPPALANGILVPQAQEQPALAMFPGPAEILTLLVYMALDKVRRRVWV